MKESMPRHVQRGIAALVAVVMGLLMLRLATQVRALQGRVEVLEAEIALQGEAASASRSPQSDEDDEARVASRPGKSEGGGANSASPPSPSYARRTAQGTASGPADADVPMGQTGGGRPREKVQEAEQDGGTKFRTPTLVELNTADEAVLVRIPGIAERTARAILEYRERLGGYVSPRQLAERLTWEAAQERMDEWCDGWLTADASLVRRLEVNKAAFRDLNAHPYLTYEQVRQLVRYRDRHGAVPGLEALRQLDAFTDEDIERLRPYLSFTAVEEAARGVAP